MSDHETNGTGTGAPIPTGTVLALVCPVQTPGTGTGTPAPEPGHRHPVGTLDTCPGRLSSSVKYPYGVGGSPSKNWEPARLLVYHEFTSGGRAEFTRAGAGAQVRVRASSQASSFSFLKIFQFFQNFFSRAPQVRILALVFCLGNFFASSLAK